MGVEFWEGFPFKLKQKGCPCGHLLGCVRAWMGSLGFQIFWTPFESEAVFGDQSLGIP